MTPAPAGAGSSVTRSVAGMGAAAALSRSFGGLRMVVIAAVLGTTYLGNTFQAANSVSNVLFELLAAGALSAVLVPTFVAHFSRGEDRRVEEVAGGVLSIALVGLGFVTVLGIAFAPQLAKLLSTGVSDPSVAAQQEELATYLLRFFIPQVLLYAIGAVATAVLHARGRFALVAMAPIGNTIVVVAAMVLFRLMAGPGPGLDLSSSEQLCLALGGTLGVAAFVGVPAVGLHRSGFRFRLASWRPWTDRDVRSLLHLSGWAALQHAGTGILLAGALLVGGGVAGGVVAYQLAMVVFLAPYGIVAQPIHTALLPRLSADAAADDAEGLHRSLRWAVEAMAVGTLPLAAALTALSAPVMSVLAFGQAAEGDGPELLGAALLGLAIGIPAYGGFLLMTRAAYALGDSRTPAIASLGSAILGAAGMVVAGQVAEGSTRLALIGGAHSLAYAAGGLWLVLRMRHRVGSVLGLGSSVRWCCRSVWRGGLGRDGGVGAGATPRRAGRTRRDRPRGGRPLRGRAAGHGGPAGPRTLRSAVSERQREVQPRPGGPGRARRQPGAGSRPADAQAEPGRVLVLSLPALAWEGLYQGDTPALDALLDESAVAAMSVRDVLPVTDAGDGYATVSAGSRAAALWPISRCSSTTRTSTARRRRRSSVATPASPRPVAWSCSASRPWSAATIASTTTPRSARSARRSRPPRCPAPSSRTPTARTCSRPRRCSERRATRSSINTARSPAEPCPRRSSSPRPPPRTASI